MKRIISVLFVLCFSISCFAQISRTFWGLTLGTSTKQQVKNVLVQKGYKITTEPDGSYSVNPDNVSFGGGYWTYVSFGFVNGKLSTVWFQNNERQCPLALNDLYLFCFCSSFFISIFSLSKNSLLGFISSLSFLYSSSNKIQILL